MKRVYWFEKRYVAQVRPRFTLKRTDSYFDPQNGS